MAGVVFLGDGQGRAERLKLSADVRGPDLVDLITAPQRLVRWAVLGERGLVLIVSEDAGDLVARSRCSSM